MYVVEGVAAVTRPPPGSASVTSSRTGVGVERKQSVRVGLAIIGAAAVVATAISVPGGGSDGAIGLAAASELDKSALGVPHVDPPGTPPHSHSDPRTKNLISRAGFEEGTVDPTTAVERRASVSYVERERALPDPKLTTGARPIRSTPPCRRPATRWPVPATRCRLRPVPTSSATAARSGWRTCRLPKRHASSSRPPGWAATCCTSATACSRATTARSGSPLSRARTPTGRWARRAAAGSTSSRWAATPLARCPAATAYRLRHAKRRLCGLSRGRHQHRGNPHGGVTSVPGGPRLRRRAHARHGLRVPRRQACTAVGRGTSTARRTRSSTARTTRRPAGNGAILETFLSGEAVGTTRSAGRRSRTGRPRTR